MKTEFVLWAVKVENEDWQEELITSTADNSKLESAKQWALKNGFNRLRISSFGGEKPDFIGSISQ